jgi:cation diffusion facilitator family transporter
MDDHPSSSKLAGHPHGAKHGWFSQIRHLIPHDHDLVAVGVGLGDSGLAGIRATKISLAGLGTTALIQAVIVLFSGSVALLSDTLHNLTDALTAIPLWIAFSLGRRRPTRTYTYGFHRAEDFAGLVVVAAIGLSAGLVIWESVRRLFDLRLIDHIPWVIVAGLVGAAGNEVVARYRIRVGRRIGSEALVTDGRHARSDAFTSLAVVAAGIGAAFGATWVDPVAGLVVAAAILWLLTRSARAMLRRLLDGVEPEVVDRVEAAVRRVGAVHELADLRVRWQGHRLQVSASIIVNSGISVAAGHRVAHDVEHELHHAFPFPVVAIIHVDPEGLSDAHDATAHHHG